MLAGSDILPSPTWSAHERRWPDRTSSLALLNLHGPLAAGQGVFNEKGSHLRDPTRGDLCNGGWQRGGCCALMQRNREEDCNGRQADEAAKAAYTYPLLIKQLLHT